MVGAALKVAIVASIGGSSDTRMGIVTSSCLGEGSPWTLLTHLGIEVPYRVLDHNLKVIVILA